jgi:hypothetical protein
MRLPGRAIRGPNADEISPRSMSSTVSCSRSKPKITQSTDTFGLSSELIFLGLCCTYEVLSIYLDSVKLTQSYHSLYNKLCISLLKVVLPKATGY